MVRRKQRFAIGKEWTRGSGKRRLLSFLACVVLIAALVGWIFPVECLGRPAESCPVLFAQDTFVPDHSLDSESQRSTQNDLAVQLFHDTLELIRNNFAGDPPDKQFFDDVLAEIALTMLPHCAESLTRSERCSDSTENCVLEAIRAATARCKVPAAPVILKALKVLLNKLDTNSGLLDPQMLEEVKISTSGTFGGIGLMVAPREGQYVVTGSFDGSPGYRAGIRAGDVVLAIEGEPLEGLSMMEVLAKVRGRPGSTISLTVRTRESQTVRQVDLQRRVIRVPPVRHVILDGGVGYLRIVNFQHNTAAEVNRAMRRMFSAARGELKGLIMDLRDNPGGLFDQGIAVADLFLSGQTITLVRGRHRRLNRDYKAGSKVTLLRAPTVILVNHGTASAAEILVGALRGKPGVLVMGERSFGKASVQGIYSLGKGMALRLTTGYYYTPDGQDIDGTGIEPDITLEQTRTADPGIKAQPLSKSDLEEDREVKHALEYLVAERSPGPPAFQSYY